MFQGKIYKNRMPEIKKQFHQTKQLCRVLSHPNLQTNNTSKFQQENVEVHGTFNETYMNFQPGLISSTAIDHLLQIQKKMKERILQIQKRSQLMINQLENTIQAKDSIIHELKDALKEKEKIIEDLQEEVLLTSRVRTSRHKF